jgi:sporulation protein YlmC with PRC-barrel domain
VIATSRHILMMTTAAALCAAPLLAFGQTGAGSSQVPTTTQTTPQQGPVSSTPAAREGVTGGATGQGGAAPGRTTQTSPRDGTPGNPPSTATGRAADAVTGQRTDPDGTGNNPPGTAAGRAVDRVTGGAPAATTDTTRPGTAATTGAGVGLTGVDSARITGGLRASKVIGSNVYNENNETIGEVDDIIIPQGATQPVAILSVGGFLGIGARLVAVPYERLQHATDRNRWVLQGATKDSLRTLPEFRYEGDTVQRRG